MVAVCVRCGGEKSAYNQICPACGHRPEGDGLLVAWLASTEHLPAERLPEVAARIAAGRPLRPSARQLEAARRALGTHFASDPGLSVQQRLGLLFTSLLFTPFVGWVMWWWWREERPRAAIQALGLSLPFSVLYFVGVLWVVVG